MTLRVLAALVLIGGSAAAQLQSTNEPTNASTRLNPGHSGPGMTDGPQYCFEIRAVSVSTDIIRPYFEKAVRAQEQNREHIPFEGWKPLDPDQSLVLDTAETRTETGSMVVKMSDREVRAFIADAQEGASNNILFAPKITLSEGQTGEISDQSKIPYADNAIRKSASAKPAEAVEGTQIFVRASQIEHGRSQADVEIQFHSLPDRNHIPLTDDGILPRKPVQTVSTVGFSALMAGDLLHTVVIPSEMLTEPLKPSRIKLASHVIGLGKSGHAEPRPIVWIVTVRRTVE